MMEDTIGIRGLSEPVIENFRVKVEDSHKQIKERLWPELSFIDLLSQDTSEIKKIAKEVGEE
jgi:hypothetical protein